MNKTYYYPSSRGVTPADHDVAYWDEYQPDKKTGGWRDWKAHLLIENPLPFRAYLENIEGHYIKGVASWQEAHEELIDLVQAMLEELVRKTPVGCEVREYTAVINEIYSDGTFIDYVIDIDLNTFDENLYLECSEILAGEITDQATLSQLINIKAEALYHKYLC